MYGTALRHTVLRMADVAVEGARRGSRIRLVLGGDLHRLAGLDGFAGAG